MVAFVMVRGGGMALLEVEKLHGGEPAAAMVIVSYWKSYLSPVQAKSMCSFVGVTSFVWQDWMDW